MTLFVTIVIVIAYLSLVVELIFFPVPSVASTYQLAYQPLASTKGSEMKGELVSVRSWSALKKIFLLIVPALLNVAVFLLPIGFLIFPLFLQKMFPIFESSTWVLGFGAALILLGRLLTFSSALRIRTENSQEGDDFHLHDDSIFRLSRNPILLGMYIMVLGLFLIFPSIIFGLGILFYMVYMHFKVLLEEDFLGHHFGKPYVDYKTKTRRYL